MGSTHTGADVRGSLGTGAQFDQRIGEQESIRVGREDCDWTTPFPDVAPVHFDLTWSSGTLWLMPFAPVYVNGEQVPACAPLPQGSRLQFGQQVLVISYVPYGGASVRPATDDEETRVAADRPWQGVADHEAPTQFAVAPPGPPSSNGGRATLGADAPTLFIRRAAATDPRRSPGPTHGAHPAVAAPAARPARSYLSLAPVPAVDGPTTVASVDELREIAQLIEAKPVRGAPPVDRSPDVTARGELGGAARPPTVAGQQPTARRATAPALDQIFALPADVVQGGAQRAHRSLQWLMIALTVVAAGAGYFIYQQMQVKPTAQIRKEQSRAERRPPPPADRVDDAPAVIVVQTAGDGEADERAAALHLLAGRLLEARAAYEKLAAAFPDDRRYAAIASIISRELARRCKPGSSLVNELCIDVAPGE